MRRLLLGFAALCLGPSVHAQIIAVYGTFSPVHASGVDTGSVTSAGGFTEQTTSFWSPGIGGGITLNFLQLPFIKLGVDLRGSTHPGTPGIDTALAGIKLAFKPPVIRLKPYVQGSVGYLGTRSRNVSTGSAAGATFNNKYLAYEVLGGVDYPYLRILDFRLIEIGAGKAIDTGINFGRTNSNPTLFTINTGVVVHF